MDKPETKPSSAQGLVLAQVRKLVGARALGIFEPAPAGWRVLAWAGEHADVAEIVASSLPPSLAGAGRIERVTAEGLDVFAVFVEDEAGFDIVISLIPGPGEAFSSAALEAVAGLVRGVGLAERRRKEATLRARMVAAVPRLLRAASYRQAQERVLEEACRIFACEAANLQEEEAAFSRIVCATGYEAFGLPRHVLEALRLKRGEYPNLRRLAEGETLIIEDTHRFDDWVPRPGFGWLRSWAGTPVRTDDIDFGTLHLDSATAGAFRAWMAPLLADYGRLAAIVLERARQAESLAEGEARLKTLTRLLAALPGHLRPETVVQSLLRALSETFAGAAAYYALGQGGPHRPSVLAARESLQQLLESGAAESLVRQIAENGQPAVSRVALGEVVTLLGFPVTPVGERARGVFLTVTDLEEDAAAQWLPSLVQVGERAAAALMAAERQQARLREGRPASLLIHALALAARPGGEREALTVACQAIQESARGADVQLLVREGEELVLRAFAGEKPLLERIPASRGISGKALRLRRAVHLRDVRRDSAYVAALAGTRAEAAVPLIWRDEAIGVVNVETPDPDRLGEEVVDWIQRVAPVLALSVMGVRAEGAALLGETQALVQRLERLHQLVDRMRVHERRQARFVADVSHQIRTPLTNICLYADLLSMGPPDKREAYLATLRKEADRLTSLVDRLLTLTRLDVGDEPIRLDENDLNMLVDVVVGDKGRAFETKGVRLEVERWHAPLPVLVDSHYLVTALGHLLTNAFQYTPRGGRVVVVTERRRREGELWATVTVRDSGPGIPEEEQARVFDRFFRGREARRQGVESSGLGLSIAKEVVEAMGGSLTLSSRPGEGAAFTIWLPQPPERG